MISALVELIRALNNMTVLCVVCCLCTNSIVRVIVVRYGYLR